MQHQAQFGDVIAWAWDGPPPGSAADGRARLALLDSLGCILAGLRHPRVRAFAEAMQGWMPGCIGVAGASLSPAGVASVLAVSMCWDEANEGLARAHGRPGLSVAPLVLAQAGVAPLGALRAAFALGYEVGARAGEVWRIRPGMHVDGSWHALGAAAASARLGGGDSGAAERAVRIAACQIPFSLYAPITAGMDGRNSYAAHAVQLGTLAGASALAGMDAPAGGLAEARRIALLREDAPAREPAGTWLVAESYQKPYAGVRHAHYAAAAALALRGGVAPEAVEAIEVATYAEALRYAGNRAPGAAITAQFSLSWAVAAALVQGDLGPAAYTDAALADPVLRRLEGCVVLREDPALGDRRAAAVTLRAGGETRTARCESVPGDPGRPMEREEIVDKFRRYAGPGAEPAIALLLDGGAGDSAAPLLELLARA